MAQCFEIRGFRAAGSVLAGLMLAAVLMRPVLAGALYPSASSARSDIDSALKQAADSNKRVLVEFGANWCSDCKVLEEDFRKTENAALLSSGFILVHVNVGDSGIDHNIELAQSYGIPLKKGVPALAVLEGDGSVVFSQKNGEFEDMRHIDPKSVSEFLTRWKK